MHEDIDKSDHVGRQAVAGDVGGQLLAGSTKAHSPRGPIPQDSYELTAPLTDGQRDLWLATQISEGAARGFNLAFKIELHGDLDCRALQDSLQTLVDRHDALRITFNETGTAQRVRPGLSVDLALRDVSGLEAPAREKELTEEELSHAREPFDMVNGPLVRFLLIRLSQASHAFLLAASHLVLDSWSIGVLFAELGQIYSAKTSGVRCQLGPAMQFLDYARWRSQQMESAKSESIEAYWLGQLANPPAPVELPARRPRPPLRSYRACSHSLVVDASSTGRLRQLAAQQDCSLFQLLLASFCVWIYRLSGQQDIVIGVPAAGQTLAAESGMEGSSALVGCCVNLLPVRSWLAGESMFSTYLNALKGQELAANERQNISLGTLFGKLSCPRDSSLSPAIAITFNLNRIPQDIGMKGLTSEVSRIPTGFDFSDLRVTVTPSGDCLRIDCSSDADLYEGSRMEALLGCWRTLIESITADPLEKLSRLPVLSDGEKRRIVVDWNQTDSLYPRESCIHQLFQRQAARTPDAISAVFADDRLTYRDLDRRANQLAHHLLGLGVGPGAMIGVCIERSLAQLVALLGILKAGCAYVPLDPELPASRLRFLLEDAGVAVAVMAEKHRWILRDTQARAVLLDAEWPKIVQEPIENPNLNVTAEHPACVMYTSGSTGNPKGVVVCHRGVVRLLIGTNYAHFGPTQRFLQLAPLSFDASTFEIWGALLHGGQCVLYPERIPTAATLGQAIRKHGINTMWLTASLFNALIDDAPEALKPIRQLLIGGEALSVPHVERALDLLPDTEIINGYGPTEGTTFTCCYPIPRRLAPAIHSIPIGRPIANTRVYVLDSLMQPVPVGVTGELYIGGDGLALGYLNRPDLTVEKFLPDPFGHEPGARLYRTGDLVRYLPDGNIEFLGRSDDQVKIRGFRIELGEIEAAIEKHRCVKQAVVMVHERTVGDKHLAAYLVLRQGMAVPTEDLQQLLRSQLPHYMMPSSFHFLEMLPVDPNGKVDRRRLPPPDSLVRERPSFVGPRTPIEKLLAGIWREILKADQVGIYDRFFELGGHSLLGMQLVSRIQAAFRVDLPLRSLFATPTIADLALIILQRCAEDAGAEAVAGMISELESLEAGRASGSGAVTESKVDE